MHAQENIKLRFDPNKSEDPVLRDIFKCPAAQILWCCIKAGHVVDQYFDKKILEVGKAVEASHTDDYGEFIKITFDLNRNFGRATVYETMMQHKDAIDNEFWGDIFRAIHHQRCFQVEIEESNPPVQREEVPANNCPECGEPYAIRCKCPVGDSKCKNGHEWHYCLKHKKVVLGPSDHSRDTFACHCNPVVED